MASLRGSNRRIAAAQERINKATAALVESYGIDAGPLPVYRRDPNRQAAEQAEWMADVLEAVAEFGAAGMIDLVHPNEAADDGFDVETPDGTAEGGTDLSKLKLAELKAKAIESGADAEAVSKMRAKADVITVIDGTAGEGT